MRMLKNGYRSPISTRKLRNLVKRGQLVNGGAAESSTVDGTEAIKGREREEYSVNLLLLYLLLLSYG